MYGGRRMKLTVTAAMKFKKKFNITELPRAQFGRRVINKDYRMITRALVTIVEKD